MAQEEEDPKEYRWETGYEKTWEAIKEDDAGFLEASVSDIIQRSKRRRHIEKQSATSSKLGMMRHIYVIVDGSDAMNCQDLKPTRLLCTVKLLEMFIEEFFDQNPISQLGIITMYNRRAEKITELVGNLRKHMKIVRGLSKIALIGEPSLQNALEMAHRSLKLLPNHASREIIVIMGSLTTCDPGDIYHTINTLKQDGIRCSVIGLAAEVHICRHLCTETGGTYNIILDDSHFKDLLFQQVDPPPLATTNESNLIKMGFPHQITSENTEELLTMCMCHVDNVEEMTKLSTGGYYCPQCHSKYCELPVECRSCGLTLVSAPHLARSYHHLFPVGNYLECPNSGLVEACFACQKPFNSLDKNVYQCPKCNQSFCVDCDIFVHDTLHTCPGCATQLSTFQNISIK